MYLIGQICGLIGTAITVIQPQFQKKVQILICTILVNTMNALNFAFIGQTGSAVYLCAVAVIQSLVAIYHDQCQSDISLPESVLFFCLYFGFGLYGMISLDCFAWHNLNLICLESLPIIGAIMLMLSVFAKGEQRTRLFLFLNGAAWAVYTALIGAAAFFTTIAAMASSAIAMWKHRSKQSRAKN